jgi:hypothetical protein
MQKQNVQPLPSPTGKNTLPSSGAFDVLKDTTGRYRLQSLFVEHKNPKYSAPYTLKPYDHRGAMSMYRKYMEIGDPTEYRIALGLLGSWAHWEALTQCTWFKPLVAKWRAELKIKFESDRYQEMLDTAEKNKGTPIGVQASKWLAERYNKEPTKRGRPSKAEKAKVLKQDKEEAALLQEEIERLGL